MLRRVMELTSQNMPWVKAAVWAVAPSPQAKIVITTESMMKMQELSKHYSNIKDNVQGRDSIIRKDKS